jgi:hypothetical protein
MCSGCWWPAWKVSRGLCYQRKEQLNADNEPFRHQLAVALGHQRTVPRQRRPGPEPNRMTADDEFEVFGSH